jgi:hypothetical protein
MNEHRYCVTCELEHSEGWSDSEVAFYDLQEAVDEISLLSKDKKARDIRLYRMVSMELPEIH